MILSLFCSSTYVEEETKLEESVSKREIRRRRRREQSMKSDLREVRSRTRGFPHDLEEFSESECRGLMFLKVKLTAT